MFGGASRSFPLAAEPFSRLAHFIWQYLRYTATAELNRFVPMPLPKISHSLFSHRATRRDTNEGTNRRRPSAATAPLRRPSVSGLFPLSSPDSRPPRSTAPNQAAHLLSPRSRSADAQAAGQKNPRFPSGFSPPSLSAT
jgi:hypothetical protein